MSTNSLLGYNPLQDPDFAKQVAELFAAGASRKDMMAALGVKDTSTITRWRRDPRVRVHLMPLIEDRIVQITRAVDSEIAQRLASASEMSVRELIEIRKEFLGGQLRAQTEKADDETVIAAMEALENDPNLVDKLDLLLSGRATEQLQKEVEDAQVPNS